MPHGFSDGIKRAIWPHLPLMGLPSAAVAIALPGPWSAVVAAAMVGEAVRGEIDDVMCGEDTVAKAVVDFLSQAAPSLVVAVVKNL